MGKGENSESTCINSTTGLLYHWEWSWFHPFTCWV